MKTFIVPVNFSPCSADAARYAVDLAQEMNAEVHLLHVVQIPVASAELSMTEDLYNQVFELVASSLKELQEELRWRANNRVPIHTASLTGSITAGVSELCDKLKPELVVLGVTGKTLEKFLTGSPVNAMLHLRQPILVVPEHAVFHPYRQIALACDETDINRGVPHSIPLIKELAERFQAKVDIVNVE
ncbi:MAG TPA: universal stress protein, partial [Puia sp.]|nr:universal stress protein [Puia sp.]